MSRTGPVSPFSRVAIIGAGLIGGSLARAAVALPGVEQVSVTDRAADARQAATAWPEPIKVADSIQATVTDADLVVLAIPAESVAAVMEELATYISPQAVVTDTGSIKSHLLVEIKSLARDEKAAGPAASAVSADALDAFERQEWTIDRFVGGHPMAGSERGGPAAADGSLFQGATWVLTPVLTTDPDAFHRLGTFLRLLGAHVLAVEPGLHDRLVAVVSHLPQVLASELMALADEAASTTGEAVLALAAGGFRDATRVAASDVDLWTGILRANREAVGEVLSRFEQRLADVRRSLEQAEPTQLRERLLAGRQARDRLPTKDRVRSMVDVVVPLDDRPGMVADVATALGEAGVNIEDLAMRHADQLTIGALVVAVATDTAERALALLTARGYQPHLEERRG